MRVDERVIIISLMVLFFSFVCSVHFVDACFNKDHSCTSDSQCCSNDCDDMNGVCLGDVTCGDNQVEGNEICDGSAGCSSTQVCKSDCSGCEDKCDGCVEDERKCTRASFGLLYSYSYLLCEKDSTNCFNWHTYSCLKKKWGQVNYC